MPSENTIYFYPGRGGHSHDGVNSSFIDTTKYSLFDFSWGLLGDPDRRATQTRNYDSFKDFIVNTINSSVLQPAGLVLQPGVVNGSAHIISRSIEANSIAANTLTANEISANTITSNELTANFVLVNTIIASNNFNGTYNANTFAFSNAGTTGWAITSSGDAVFTNGLFRGNLFVGSDDYWYSNGAFALGGNTGIYRNVGGGITLGANVTITGSLVATSVSTPGVDILSNGTLIANTFALYGNGALVTSSGNFYVDEAGNLSATNANIAGTINSTSGSIAGWTITNDTISAAGGDIYLYQEPGYGSVNAGSGAGQQILLNSDAELYAEFGSVTTQINYQSDTAYVFRIQDGGLLTRISPSLFSAVDGASFSVLSNDSIYTTGEVGMSTGSVGGIGIEYPGCSTGGGTPNYMGFLWANPNIRGTVDNAVSAVLGTVSDIRSKVNIVDAPNEWALKTLNNLRVVEYNPIDILNPDDKTEKPKRLGLIAQELVDVFPELVTSVNPDNPDAILSVDYLGLVPHLIQVIKLLNDKIEYIEQQIGE